MSNKICPNCGAENREEAKFCKICAADIKNVEIAKEIELSENEKLCPNCKTVNNIEAKFCKNCAKSFYEESVIEQVAESDEPIEKIQPQVIEREPVSQEAVLFSKSKRKSIPLPLLICVIVVLIAAVVFAVYGKDITNNFTPKTTASATENENTKPITQATTQTPTEAKTEAPTEAPTEKPSTSENTFDWKSEYKSILNGIVDYGFDGTIKYYLYDLSGDNIPELIVYTAQFEDNAMFDFYNCGWYLGSYSAFHSSLEVADGNLYCDLTHMGMQYIDKLTIKDDEIVGERVYSNDYADDYIQMGEELTVYDISDLSPLN